MYLTPRIPFHFPAAPPTLNHMWGRHGSRTYLKKVGKDFHQLVANILDKNKLPPDWKYVHVDIIIRPPRRRCDVDNRVKALLDSFTRAGYWEDDEIVASFSVSFLAPQKGNKTGETFVYISKVEEKYK